MKKWNVPTDLGTYEKNSLVLAYSMIYRFDRIKIRIIRVNL
jgi:hypothetical protein